MGRDTKSIRSGMKVKTVPTATSPAKDPDGLDMPSDRAMKIAEKLAARFTIVIDERVGENGKAKYRGEVVDFNLVAEADGQIACVNAVVGKLQRGIGRLIDAGKRIGDITPRRNIVWRHQYGVDATRAMSESHGARLAAQDLRRLSQQCEACGNVATAFAIRHILNRLPKEEASPAGMAQECRRQVDTAL